MQISALTRAQCGTPMPHLRVDLVPYLRADLLLSATRAQCGNPIPHLRADLGLLYLRADLMKERSALTRAKCGSPVTHLPHLRENLVLADHLLPDHLQVTLLRTP